MCGIALIISGIKIDLSFLIPDYIRPATQFCELPLVSEDEIKAALQRRGPDSLGAKVVGLYSEASCDKLKGFVVQSCVQKQGAAENGCGSESSGELHFIGATLQLRGVSPVVQPLTDEFGSVLVYNGEIYEGIPFRSDNNDTEILMQSVGRCCSCISHVNGGSSACSEGHEVPVPQLLPKIRGPWALIYWQVTVRDTEEEKGKTELDFWEELSCGVHSVSITPLKMGGYLTGEVKKHGWTDFELKEFITWERNGIEPKPENLSGCFDCLQSAPLVPAQKVLKALAESV